MAQGTQQRFIGQLTGVRFVAAFWVMLYHYQGALATAGLLVPVLHEVLRVGRLGVDLFFALSGFILTHTYLTKLGPRITWTGTRHFWWLRLARIYPVHFVMLNVAGVAAVAQQKLGSSVSGTKDWLTPLDYLRQVLLVHEWGPNPQRGWNYPAWSLSMEWLAYLLFPLLVLALFRFRDRLSTRMIAVLWCAVLVPLLWYGIAYYGDPYYISDWGSTIRILTEFTAGGLTYLFVLRQWTATPAGVRPRVERLATTLSVAIPVVIVGTALVLGHIGALQWSVSDLPDTPNAADLPPKYHLVLVPLLVAWIGALALTNRGPVAVPVHRPPRARWVRLLLALHDAHGLVRPVAGGHEGRPHRRWRPLPALVRRARGRCASSSPGSCGGSSRSRRASGCADAPASAPSPSRR